jgi:predicted TIM-barrel fold metal-dependent hydrolase
LADKSGRFVIALEEHYWDRELAEHFKGGEGRNPALREKLDSLGELRLRAMDEAGIDVQVLSHGAPATQRLDAGIAVDLARRVNDRLHASILERPTRFAGFAALPTADPRAAAEELERAVTKLGFKGAMVHGMTNGVFFDDRRFWPIYERARALDVPLYIHPALPHPAVIETYYRDYVKDYPSIVNAGWGFTVETATQGIRIVLSGVLEAYPGVKLILGHLGEGLPFSLWRIDHALSREENRSSSFRESFREHFWITTSGNFSTAALLCSVMELGVDRIMFSVDWPFVANGPGVEWIETVPLSSEDKNKIMHGNAQRLLKM